MSAATESSVKVPENAHKCIAFIGEKVLISFVDIHQKIIKTLTTDLKKISTVRIPATIITSSFNFSVAPRGFSDFLSDEQQKTLLPKANSADVILLNNNLNEDTEIFYNCSPLGLNEIEDVFYIPNYQHILESLNNFVKASSKSSVAISSYYEEKLAVAVKSDDQIVYLNVLPCKSADEGLFHLLQVFDELHLDREEFPLILLGDIDQQEVLLSNFKKFIRTVHSPVHSQVKDFRYSGLFILS